jgi:hypothetical protein
MLFKPQDVNDGPHPNQIRDDRITVMHSSDEIFRESRKAAATAGDLVAWSGVTCQESFESQLGCLGDAW